MVAAAALDIDVATTEFTRFDEEWAIVIERFDRGRVNGRIERIHQEDFAQACGRMPEQKHESNDGPTLEHMMRVVSRESTDLHEDRLALADFLAFNLVAGAPDGHAKNVALLRPQGAVHVAPLFDLATGLADETRDVDRRVALSIGGARSAARIHRTQWERAARTLGIASETLLARVATLASAAPSAFAATLGAMPTDVPGFAEVTERLLPALELQATTVMDRL